MPNPLTAHHSLTRPKQRDGDADAVVSPVILCERPFRTW